MLSTGLIGNTNTYVKHGLMITPRGYANKYDVEIGNSAAREDMQKSLNTIVQTAFARLDLVTREQFDAQLETLERTREQLIRLQIDRLK